MTTKIKKQIWSLFFRESNPKKYIIFLKKHGQPSLPKGQDEIEYHLHHIIPKNWFFENRVFLSFMNDAFNVIYLSRSHHALAHQLLFDLVKDSCDKGAFYLLENLNNQKALKQYPIAGAKATHKLLREQKKNFWNSTHQKQNAKKSLEKPDALLTRSLSGKKGGYSRNKNRIINSTIKILFLFENVPFLCIFNCQTGGDIVRILNSAKPSKMKRISPLVTGKRKTAYDWSCVILNETK